jgi:putative tryptophan/tyrosine transport system substrate-binding protein
LAFLSLFPATHLRSLHCLTNCGAAASSKVKTSPSTIAIFGPHPDLISQYATELVNAKANVIRGGGGLAIRTLQQATKTIPIIGISDDMLGEGLVGSLARPSGNVTGVSILATELDGKRQEILAEAVPGLRKLGVLADANNASVAKLDAMREAAHSRGIELSVQRIAKGDDIPAAIDTAKASRKANELLGYRA